MIDATLLEKIGFRGAELESTTVGGLIDRDVLDRPLDGNHGEIHPKASDYVENGIPFVMATDLKNGRIDLDGCYKIPENIANGLRKGFAKTGDVLLSHKATLGRVARVGEITNDFIVLTPQTTYYRVLKPKVLHPDYLVQYFRSQYFQDIFKLWGGAGSTRAYLGITAQKKLPIVFPSIASQKKIAAILTAYDDLIENNRRRIAQLEKMAEEIYCEWFVRLRFPGHEHASVHKGVPEGWEFRRLDTFGKVITGKTPPTSKRSNYGGDIPFIKTPDMHGNTFIYVTEETLTEDGLNSQPSQTLPANSLCVSCIGTGGVVSITTKRCSTNQQINSICLKNELDLEWLFFTLRSLKGAILAFGASGATMTNLSKGKFSGLKPPVPPPELREKFHDLVEPIFTQTKLLVQASLQLSQARDLLLNRLISGKLRVDDLEIQFPPSMHKEGA